MSRETARHRVLKTDWTAKSATDCVFIGYSETENLYQLWNVKKKDFIMKRDVIFCEDQLGHRPLTNALSLPEGYYIM